MKNKQLAKIVDRVTGEPLVGADFEIRYQVNGEEHVKAGSTDIDGNVIIIGLPKVKNALVIASYVGYAMRTSVMDIPIDRQLVIGLDLFEMPEAPQLTEEDQGQTFDDERTAAIQQLILAVRYGYSLGSRPDGMSDIEWEEHIRRARKICRRAHAKAEETFPEEMLGLPKGGIDALISM